MKRVWSNKGRALTRSRLVGTVAVGSMAMMFTSGVSASVLFDYQPVPSPSSDSIVALPTLSDGADLAALADFLDNNQPDGHRAVKVLSDLSDATAEAAFGSLDLDFVFADLEGPRPARRTRDLVQQVNQYAPDSVVVGNFATDPYHPDATASNPNGGVSDSGYKSSLVTMSNENLYPGSSSFKSPDGPSILADLFTLPITRLSEVSLLEGVDIDPSGDELILFPEEHKHIPYVTRFNSNNSPLVNSEFEGAPAFETTDQLLSRGDFSALLAHYRLRGADSAVLFEPGVVGYTKEQMRDDALDGWELLDAEFDEITGLVSPSLDINVDGSTQSLDDAGAVWSGIVYEEGELLTILLSNMNDSAKEIILPDEIAGMPVASDDKSFIIPAGSHWVLDFSDFLNEWSLDNGPSQVFEDSERGGIGIPEPTSFVVLGLSGLMMLLPSRTRNG